MAPPRVQESPAAPIKGSWEEMIQRAHSLMATRDEEALEIFNKLIKRLTKMSQSQLTDQNNRLHNILTQSIGGAQSFLTVLERYDEAVDLFEQVRETVESDVRRSIDTQRARILLMADRWEDAAAQFRALADADDGNPNDLNALFQIYIENDNFDQAEETIEELIQQLNESQDALSVATEPTETEAYRHYLRGRLALQRGKIQETLEHYQKSMELSSRYAEDTSIFYIELIHRDYSAEALTLIEHDRHNPQRRLFWEGLAQYRLGNPSAAESLWIECTELEPPEGDQGSPVELIMAFYYLGDKERHGLELLLRTLRESEGSHWMIHYLLGMGWALHGNRTNATANLESAVNLRRASAEGRLLPHYIRTFMPDLVTDDIFAEVEPFIEKAPANYIFNTANLADSAEESDSAQNVPEPNSEAEQ
ncbi:hypothetical protein KFU94_12845 [Chloroflexi bacterium TSY]|nr:hypothetical protein [Chloroflexi bacterium TSY]